MPSLGRSPVDEKEKWIETQYGLNVHSFDVSNESYFLEEQYSDFQNDNSDDWDNSI